MPDGLLADSLLSFRRRSLAGIDVAPLLVRLQVWGVPRRNVPHALLRMARGRTALSGAQGLRFAKQLGTGSGETFRPRHADLRHWAVLTVWENPEAADSFAASSLPRSWDSISDERLDLDLRPLASRGRWSGATPFGDPAPERYDGVVAAITRARLVLRKSVAFRRAVPAVAAELHRSPGLRFALAIGEAPVGLQGTFSVWNSPADMNAFAGRRAAHQDVVARTAAEGWYAEELFARFAVLRTSGTFAGRPLAAG